MIDFTTANDSGYNTNDSIQPVADGEFANQTVFRRPSENLRVRTEKLRKYFQEAELVSRFYDRLQLNASNNAAKIKLYGTSGAYKFLLSVNGEEPSDVNLEFSGLMPSSVKYAETWVNYGPSQDMQQFIVRTQIAADSGGNNIFFQIVSDPQAQQITITHTPAGGDPADGPVLIKATLPLATTLGDLQSALASDGLLRMPYVSNTTAAAPASIPSFNVGKSFNTISDDPHGLGHSAPAIINFTIPASKINEFFTDNTLAPGEILVANFGSLSSLLAADGLTNVELEKIATNPQTGSLPIIAPDLAEGAVIPIAKVIEGESGVASSAQIIFIDGRTFPHNAAISNQAVHFDSGVVEDRVATSAKGESGDPVQLPMGDVKTQLTQLLSALNDHIKGNLYKHELRKILFAPFVTVGTFGNFTALSDAIGALLSTGGTIYLLEDITFSSPINVNTLSGDIYILGNGHTISHTASNDLVLFNNTNDSNYAIVFVNTKLTGNLSTYQNLIIKSGSGNLTLYFYNCEITAPSTTGSTKITVGPNCKVFAAGTLFEFGVAFYNADSTDKNINFTFEDCKFRDFAFVSQTVSASGLLSFVFRDCVVKKEFVFGSITWFSPRTPIKILLDNVTFTDSDIVVDASSVTSSTVDFSAQDCDFENLLILIKAYGTLQTCKLDSCKLENVNNSYNVFDETAANLAGKLYIRNCDVTLKGGLLNNAFTAINIKGVNVSFADANAFLTKCNTNITGDINFVFSDSKLSLGSYQLTAPVFRFESSTIYRVKIDNVIVENLKGKLISGTGSDKSLFILKNNDCSVYSNNATIIDLNTLGKAIVDSLQLRQLDTTHFNIPSSYLIRCTELLNSGIKIYTKTDVCNARVSRNNIIDVYTDSVEIYVLTGKIFIGNEISEPTGNDKYAHAFKPMYDQSKVIRNTVDQCRTGVYITGAISLNVSHNSFILKSALTLPSRGIYVNVSGLTIRLNLNGNYFYRDGNVNAFGIVNDSGTIAGSGMGNIFRKFSGYESDVYSGADASLQLEPEAYHTYSGASTQLQKFLAHQKLLGS